VIEQNLCTHILFADYLDYNAAEGFVDRPQNVRQMFVDAVAAFKSAGLKVLITIGNLSPASYQGPLVLSKMFAKNASRVKTVSRLLSFVEINGLDGVNILWGFPACPQTLCASSFSADKQNYVLIAEEFRRQFSPENLMVTAHIPPTWELLEKGECNFINKIF